MVENFSLSQYAIVVQLASVPILPLSPPDGIFGSRALAADVRHAGQPLLPPTDRLESGAKFRRSANETFLPQTRPVRQVTCKIAEPPCLQRERRLEASVSIPRPPRAWDSLPKGRLNISTKVPLKALMILYIRNITGTKCDSCWRLIWKIWDGGHTTGE